MSFERVGSSQPIAVDVRIVAATHQDLEALIQSGRFREDLYYRLNVICLHVPALRERREDIIELAVFFLKHHAARTEKLLTHIEPEAVEMLMAHDWPGNIRELENVIERAVVLADGPAVTTEDLPPEVRSTGRRRLRSRRPLGSGSSVVEAAAGTAATSALSPTTSSVLSRPQRPAQEADHPTEDWNAEFLAYERQRLRDALHEAGGNKSTAARLLGMPRSTFISKLKKHELLSSSNSSSNS
jgi:DNA-binding NtrC family response regulator